MYIATSIVGYVSVCVCVGLVCVLPAVKVFLCVCVFVSVRTKEIYNFHTPNIGVLH